MPWAAEKRRRWLAGWIVAFGVVALVAGSLTLFSLVRDWGLIRGDGRRVTGAVVDERNERFCVRNLVTVRYRIDGRIHVAEVPTKGRGFGGLCIHPYFYKRGHPVALIVDPSDADHVRTVERWSPLAYNTGGVFAFCLAVLCFCWFMWWRFVHRRRSGA